MKIIYSVALGGALMLSVQAVQAAIALDRTRAILDGGEKAIALTIRNDNPHLPYLAQAWLEDLEGHRITGPLIAVPPVQRVEPATKSQISISSLPSVSTLPQDRESAFYFNVREIPPRSDKANVMQVALQTKIKVFYRP
ncbi:MAG: fimbria/pilus periplasmic chaperone, partial [Acinetobacter sp.]